MSDALHEALEARRVSSAARSWRIAAVDAARLAAFRSALLAGHRGETLAPRAFGDGLAAAAELAAQDLSVLVRSASASGWTAELVDMAPVGGKKLDVTSPEADRLEFFFDANGSLYLGGLTATVDGSRVSIPFRRADASGSGGVEIIANGLDASAPAVHAAPQLNTILGGVAAAAGLAAEAARTSIERAAPASPRESVSAGVEPRRQKFCRQCGNAHKPDDRFCAYCGASLATGSTAEREASDSPRRSVTNDGGALTCPACGGALKPAWKFCRACGAKLP